MYVWDKFTMSLVLMYRKPTCGQTEGSGVRQGPSPLPSAGSARGLATASI